MKPLRPLAEGWEYRTSEEGQLVICRCTCATEGMAYSVVKDKAAECFADAKPEEPPREGDRVVVLTSVGGVYDSCHGICAGARSAGISVWLDNGEGPYNFLYEDVRHEREDERPAEKAEPDPKPLRKFGVPKTEKKPEPPRKYEDGQCVNITIPGVPGIIDHAEFKSYGRNWTYFVTSPATGKIYERWEGDLSPCPPRLTDAQRRLQPGDKVRVQAQCWDADGKLIRSSIVDPFLAGTILRSWLEKEKIGPVKCAVRFGMGEDMAEYLHNLGSLDSAEEK